MRRLLMIALCTTALTLLAIGLACAVGYEPVETAEKPAAARNTRSSLQADTLYDKLKQATFLERYPEILDEVAFSVRDILSQFGITDMKARRNSGPRP